VREAGRSDGSRDDQDRVRSGRARIATGWVRYIDECVDCAATCTGCADCCLGEEDVQELVRCIRLDLDRADACAQLRAASSPASPRAMLASSAQRSKPARRPVARGSVSGTPRTTTTVGSAPEPAAAASKPATTSSPRPADRNSFLGRGLGRWLPTFVHGARRGRNKSRLPPVGRCFRRAERAGAARTLQRSRRAPRGGPPPASASDASVSTTARATRAPDELRASAGARPEPVLLLHS
jgi:hypothetical protein